MGQDLSMVLRPGVYVLRERGRVVWVGAAKRPLLRLYGHANHRRGEPLRSWLPYRPVRFDSIELFPCLVDELAPALAAKCEELGWSEPRLRSVA